MSGTSKILIFVFQEISDLGILQINVKITQIQEKAVLILLRLRLKLPAR